MLLEMRQLRGLEVAERGAFGQAARIPAAEDNAVRDFTSRDLRHVLDLAGGALRLNDAATVGRDGYQHQIRAAAGKYRGLVRKPGAIDQADIVLFGLLIGVFDDLVVIGTRSGGEGRG